MAELKNCARCGKIFAMNVRDICHDCYRKEEEDYKKVYQFLTKKKNREATVSEIVEATEVEEDTIIKFIKQNRLRASQFPNLAYPCEQCDALITEGRLCYNCASEIKTELHQLDMRERIAKERKEREESIYYTMNKNKKARKD